MGERRFVANVLVNHRSKQIIIVIIIKDMKTIHFSTHKLNLLIRFYSM